MRRTRYLTAIEEAKRLPERVPGFAELGIFHAPRQAALDAVAWAARKDEGLYHCEVLDILKARAEVSMRVT